MRARCSHSYTKSGKRFSTSGVMPLMKITRLGDLDCDGDD